MNTSDAIASLSLVIALGSTIVAALALRESRRANQIALFARRCELYDAFHSLAVDALCHGTAVGVETIQAFERHASEVRKVLPSPLDDEVAEFYDDVQFLFQAQSMTGSVDPHLASRIADAAARVHSNALDLDNRLLKVVRTATDA